MLGSDRPRTPEELAEAIWNEETGETFYEALERFSEFGDQHVVDAKDVIDLPQSTEVWAFGYGDDPEEFNTVTVEELVQTFTQEVEADDSGDPDLARERALQIIDDMWGPFILYRTHPEDILLEVLQRTNPLVTRSEIFEAFKALTRAGVEILTPEQLIWGHCPMTGEPHTVSTSLCSGCLEYDPE